MPYWRIQWCLSFQVWTFFLWKQFSRIGVTLFLRFVLSCQSFENEFSWQLLHYCVQNTSRLPMNTSFAKSVPNEHTSTDHWTRLAKFVHLHNHNVKICRISSKICYLSTNTKYLCLKMSLLPFYTSLHCKIKQLCRGVSIFLLLVITKTQ